MSNYTYKSNIKEPTFEEQVVTNAVQALFTAEVVFGEDFSEVVKRLNVLLGLRQIQEVAA